MPLIGAHKESKSEDNLNTINNYNFKETTKDFLLQSKYKKIKIKDEYTQNLERE